MYKFHQVHKYVDTPIYLSVKKEKGRVKKHGLLAKCEALIVITI
jgi:hypothetical protein